MKNKTIKLNVFKCLFMMFALITVLSTTLLIMLIKSKNEGTFDNLVFSSFESQYEELQFDYLPNYEFLNCYGDVTSDDIEDYMADFLGWFPKTFSQFLEDGGVVILADDIHGMAKEYFNLDSKDIGDKARGLFLTKDNRPIICIDVSEMEGLEDDPEKQVLFSVFESSNTAIHEMAHYIDHKNGFSATNEFKEYFKRYAKDYEPRNAVVKGYQATNEKEFFAVLFNDVLRNSHNDKYIIPNVLKEFMIDVIGNEQ